MQRVATAIDRYEVDNLRLPTDLSQLVGQGNGTGPSMGVTNWGNGFKDEWGTELRYRLLDGTYELRSAGPDRTFETQDDLTIGPNTASQGAALPRRP